MPKGKLKNLREVDESMRESLNFELVFDEGGKLKGFDLYGLGETYSEAYALSFVKAQQLGNTDICYEDGHIVFKHGGVNLEQREKSLGVLGSSAGGIFKAPVHEPDWLALKDILECSNEKKPPTVKYKLAFGKGFYFGIK